jgi:hypothetical protein
VDGTLDIDVSEKTKICCFRRPAEAASRNSCLLMKRLAVGVTSDW